MVSCPTTWLMPSQRRDRRSTVSTPAQRIGHQLLRTCAPFTAPDCDDGQYPAPSAPGMLALPFSPSTSAKVPRLLVSKLVGRPRHSENVTNFQYLGTLLGCHPWRHMHAVQDKTETPAPEPTDRISQRIDAAISATDLNRTSGSSL